MATWYAMPALRWITKERDTKQRSLFTELLWMQMRQVFAIAVGKNKCVAPTQAMDGGVEVSFNMLPHIDSQDPPMAKRFKAIMTRRPSVERMIKRLKCDLGDDRLKKRSNASFQAYLDKTMIAFHILLRN